MAELIIRQNELFVEKIAGKFNPLLFFILVIVLYLLFMVISVYLYGKMSLYQLKDFWFETGLVYTNPRQILTLFTALMIRNSYYDMLNRMAPQFKDKNSCEKLRSKFIEKKIQILLFIIILVSCIVHIYAGILDGFYIQFGGLYIVVLVMFLFINSVVLADFYAELIALLKLPANLKGKLKFNIMHNDNCMGYSPIGYFYLKIAVMMFLIAGIQSLTASMYLETSDIIAKTFEISMILMWIAGIITFLYPSIIFIGEMNKIKKKEMHWINLEINKYYENCKLNENFDEENHIFKLLDLQDRINKVHVVPMNIGMMRKFALSTFIPFIGNIGEIIHWF